MLNSNDNILTEEEYNLYSKNLILECIGKNGQNRLKKSKVLVIGAGGLGCPAMIYLITSGIGYLGIIDSDKIEISNLNRQILYNFTDIDKYKTNCAKDKLRKMNPFCKIILHSYKFNENNCTEIIQYYDLIIDCTDSIKTRYIIDNCCNKLHKVHMYGAVNKFNVHISTFNYQNSVKYSEIYPLSKHSQIRDCSNSGILGVTTGYTAIIQIIETIKIILGIKIKLSNKLLISDLINLTEKQIKVYSTKATCEKEKNLVKYELKGMHLDESKLIKKKRKKHFFLLDVRNNNEFQEKHIKRAVNLPINEFKKNKTKKFLNKYKEKGIYLVYCKSNYRSIIVYKILKSYNIENYIIKD
uniref:Molybdopterin biosynthesis protein n=1 Tax=Platysiphonia delicata TaxID=2006979 RepID=A0A1Z1M190_9FLOR|nr:Molybdopterin biosynthesis protein [Platysiphonia delicata]ARW59670.1 Molybdopterin biosynthesis protein [Platysiphonia delicata]